MKIVFVYVKFGFMYFGPIHVLFSPITRTYILCLWRFVFTILSHY